MIGLNFWTWTLVRTSQKLFGNKTQLALILNLCRTRIGKSKVEKERRRDRKKGRGGEEEGGNTNLFNHYLSPYFETYFLSKLIFNYIFYGIHDFYKLFDHTYLSKFPKNHIFIKKQAGIQRHSLILSNLIIKENILKLWKF